MASSDGSQPIKIIPYYQKSQWQRLKDISDDADQFSETYEEWVAQLEEAVKKLENRGVLIKKVVVDTEEMLSWCNRMGLPVNRYARTQFAEVMARKKKD